MKMSHICTVIVTIISLSFCNTITIQGGVSLSKLNWSVGNIENAFYNHRNRGYSFLVGVDYLDKHFFNLSSNIGIIRKGGMDSTANGDMDGAISESSVALDYLTLNSAIDLKFPIKDAFFPFISIGPRFDFLVKESDEFDTILGMKKYSLGLLLGGGVKYSFTKIVIGMRLDYYLNFNDIANWERSTTNVGGDISDNTLTINMILGFKYNI